MKTFEEIYEELKNGNNIELDNIFQEVKEKKQKAKKITTSICLIIDIIILLVLLVMAIIVGEFFLMFFMPALVFGIMSNVLTYVIVYISVGASKKQQQLNNKYKDIIVRKLMNNFYNNLEYFPNKEMPEYIYEQPNYEYYNRYHSDDYFEALINNNYSIQMAEILTQKEESYTDSDGHRHTRTITKFHGLFSKITIDKSINSELRIMTNGGILFDKDKLNMDSSEFEKYFDVKASNKIIAMQLLTADIMEELIMFKNKTNMTYDVVINNNEIYLRFHSGEMFEATRIKGDALDKDVIEKYYYMLNFTYNLSNKLIKVINTTQI